jgi:hypothetical protein
MVILSNKSPTSLLTGQRIPEYLDNMIDDQGESEWDRSNKVEDKIERNKRAIVQLIETLYEAGIMNQSHIQTYLEKLGYYGIEIEKINPGA